MCDASIKSTWDNLHSSRWDNISTESKETVFKTAALYTSPFAMVVDSHLIKTALWELVYSLAKECGAWAWAQILTIKFWVN